MVHTLQPPDKFLSDTCGQPTKTTGDPCQRAAGSCPFHEPRTRGRPTKYDPKFCREVIELGRDGYTIVEMAAEFDVARKTVYEWMERHPNFRNALSRAKDLAEAWWTKQGRSGIWSREFNASAYRLQMMNRFNWGEKSSHDVDGNVSVVVETVIYDDADEED